MNDEIIIEEEIEDEIEMEGDDVVYKIEKDYNKLDNKPSINNITLEGNKTLHELGIQAEGDYVEQEEGKGLISDTEKAQIETNKTDIATIKTEQITQNNNITNLQANKANVDDVYNKTTIDNMLDTKANKSETYTKTETDTLLQDKADTEDIPDVSGFITKDVDNLTNYTLKTNTGSLIDLEINQSTYVITLSLKNQDGTVISTDTIDLPLESVVVSGRYDNTTKKVILTLENGSEVDFSVADLVAGLQTEITSTNKLASDLVDDTNSGNKFTNTTEKQTWNNKYDKPSGGIPKTDLASTVQSSLNKADTALQTHQDISGKEDKSNKVTEINETSTDTQYPSAKAVHNKMANLGTTKTTSGISIDITDSAEGNMPLGIKGNTSQQTYTGKNLFNGTFRQGNVNGTVNNTNIFCDVNEWLVAGQSYTISTNLNITNYRYRVFANELTFPKSNTDPESYTSDWNTTSSFTFTLPKNSYFGLGIQRIDGENLTPSDIENVYFQLEEGSTATPYEPYVGGTASPNPSYPQEVKTVTGEVNVKVANGNLFKISNYSKSGWLITIDNPLKNMNAGDYTISCQNKYITSGKGIRTYFSNEQFGEAIGAVFTDYTFGNSKMNETKSITQEQINAKYLIFYPNDNQGSQEVLENMQIMINQDTTATEYIEHQEQNYPINLGKNLFDIANWVTKGNNSNYYSYSNGNLYVNALDTRGLNDFNENEKIYLPNGTYTISNEGSAGVRIYNNGTDYPIIQAGAFEVTLGYIYLKFVSSTVITCQPMIEKGSTATEYAPYFTPIELCKIGDYQDYIHKDNGKWHKHKEIEKVVLDGTETWGTTFITATNSYAFYNTELRSILTYGNKICNYFPYEMKNWDVSSVNTLCENDTTNVAILFNIATNIATTVNEWKTWLSTHNTIIYFVLKTPVEEEITEPTLIAQLEAIYNNAKSYEGETHIFTITENESPYIEAEYSIDNVENTLNKATSIDENSTNKEYPSAKAVYDYGQSIADKGEVYSTEEQVIGKWIDGKPLYEITYQTTSPSSTNSATNIVDISSLNFEYIRIADGNLDTGALSRPLNMYVSNEDRNITWIRKEQQTIAMIVGNSAMVSKTVYITIQYTKTTD